MTNNGETRETITQVNRFSIKTCLGLKREEAARAAWGLVWGIHLEQTSSGKKKNKTNKQKKKKLIDLGSLTKGGVRH